MSIPNIYNKIKSKIGVDKVTFVYLCIIIGVGIGAFGLGRLSVDSEDDQKDEVIIQDVKSNILKEDLSSFNDSKNLVIDKSISEKEEISIKERKYVASKNGKLYYSLGCKAANRIKPENQIWFKSISDAELSGYTPSSSCK